MSFSQDVKTELMEKYTKAAHCQKAQLAAFMIFDPKNLEKDADSGCCIYSFTSIRKTFNIGDTKKIRQEGLEKLTEKTCCKRAFLRGAFIGAGTISDPEKEYRFDIICADPQIADFLKEQLASFGIAAKVTERRGRFVLYLKEAEAISDALNVLEAHRAMMQFENIRILKEMRGSVNRQVNCETANINKAVNAAMKQTEEIRYLIERIGLENLDEHLAVVANARLEFPDATLAELGNLISPPISKSAVNHRMRKINQLAADLRQQERAKP